VKEEIFRKGAPCGNPSAKTQLFAADRQTRKKTLRCSKKVPEETRNANAAPQVDKKPGARGAHSGESCTGTDVDTGGSSRPKRPLSPGGTPQDAQRHVKRTKQKQKETPYNS